MKIVLSYVDQKPILFVRVTGLASFRDRYVIHTDLKRTALRRALFETIIQNNIISVDTNLEKNGGELS